MNRNIKGIVLRQVPYKEKDAMITILSEDGIVSFLARGILSPTSKNASSCMLYSYSDFSLSYKGNNCTLTQSKIIKTFMQVYSDLELIACTSLMGEVTLKLGDEEVNRFLFPYFLKGLYEFENKFDPSTILAIYLANVIKLSGYSLNYSECVLCGSKKNLAFVDFNEGGFICSRCANKIKEENVEYLKSFRYVFMVSSDLLTHYKLKKDISSRLINEFSSYLCSCFGLNRFNSLELYNKSKK